MNAVSCIITFCAHDLHLLNFHHFNFDVEIQNKVVFTRQTFPYFLISIELHLIHICKKT